MQSAFAIVLFVVVGGGIVLAIVTAVTSASTYGQIGRGDLSIGEDRPLRPTPVGGAMTPGQAAEREAEIRQMLEARNARRAARGLALGDVDAELRELTAPAVEPGIEAELRELVVSRNARRLARGQEPLDVDAEVARRLRELA
ncbi:MAG: hypothetical protein QOK21_3824 [Solirubrobacteraceae bacterium]|jgi:hypothetical protein|nr:hypothetical protein [Solirubrobacteraceae bacterium]